MHFVQGAQVRLVLFSLDRLQNKARSLELLSARELDIVSVLLLACQSCALMKSHLQVMASSVAACFFPGIPLGYLKGIFPCTVPLRIGNCEMIELGCME